jgi:tetratricopeptide (TPR) repeat protein
VKERTLPTTRANAAAPPRNWLEAGLERRKAGDRPGAEAAIRAALAARPGDATALFLLGVVKQEAGELDEAAGAFGAVVAANPRHAVSWLNLAALQMRQGEALDAAASLSRVLEIEPGRTGCWTALSQCLLSGGKPGEALDAARRAAVARPDDAEAHMATGAALTRLGDPKAAISAYSRALALDDARALAHLGLALAQLQLNQPEAALPAVDRAIFLDPNAPMGWLAFGLALRGVGDAEGAVKAFRRASELDGRLAQAHAQLGELEDELNRPLLAEANWRRALELAPGDVAAHVALSSLYCRAERFDLGRFHAEQALKSDPNHFGAHQNLAGICAREGQADAARQHRDIAFGARNLITVRAARPIRQVLVLASTEAANSPDRYLLPAHRYSRHLWFMDYARSEQFSALPSHDIVFNAIADPDCSAAKVAELQRFARMAPRRLLNPPARIARTGRQHAAELFDGVGGLVTPRTMRLSAADLTLRGARETIVRSGLRLPILIRPVGSHGGEGLVRIHSPDSLDALWRASGGGWDVYATEFHDFRSEDGLYRKYRMFFINRQPFPYHLAISDHWLVHYDKSGTAGHPQRLAEEHAFLSEPERTLGLVAMDAIRNVGRRLDLDFAGVDFTLLGDGRALLFEANATMLVHDEAPGGALAHKNAHVHRIFEAFWTMLEDAAPELAA